MDLVAGEVSGDLQGRRRPRGRRSRGPNRALQPLRRSSRCCASNGANWGPWEALARRRRQALAAAEARAWGGSCYRASLGAGLGANERVEHGDHSRRGGVDVCLTGTRVQGSRRRGALASMAEHGSRHGGDQEIGEKKKKLTANLSEVVARSESFCGRRICRRRLAGPASPRRRFRVL